MLKKILKSYILNLKSPEGFTLIELLAVIFVFITVGTLVMSILVSVLRGNNKTNSINGVAGNGNYALSQMLKSIRDATVLESTFSCGTVNSPTATSAVELAFPNGTVTTYNCLDSNNNLAITSNSASLIDANTITVTACQFTCGQDAVGGYPILGIDFSLQQKGSSTFIEQKASASAVEFQTSVVMRNSIR